MEERREGGKEGVREVCCCTMLGFILPAIFYWILHKEWVREEWRERQKEGGIEGWSEGGTEGGME